MLKNTLRNTLRQGLDTVRAANTGGTPVRDGKLDPAAQGNAYSVDILLSLAILVAGFTGGVMAEALP